MILQLRFSPVFSPILLDAPFLFLFWRGLSPALFLGGLRRDEAPAVKVVFHALHAVKGEVAKKALHTVNIVPVLVVVGTPSPCCRTR